MDVLGVEDIRCCGGFAGDMRMPSFIKIGAKPAPHRRRSQLL